MNKIIAATIILFGGGFAIAPWNPFGEPELHPNPWIVCFGAVVAAIGGYLFAYRVTPQEPGFRVTGICVMVASIGVGLASVFL